ncbi:hypothetical protein GCM10027341_23900 [Spirosoma knui]
MKTKILLVDDEADLAALFKKWFRPQIRAGTYEFVFAYDGQEALGLLEQQPDIDLVLSDINMPGMDGLTLLGKVTEVNPMVRTVMVTAYGDMANIRLAMNRGAFDFITKPINFDDLEVTIAKAKQAVQQVREAAELKAMDAMKTRFFANITHELRTPLSLIVTPVDKLLETDDLPVPYQQQLTTVRRNARQLLRLINQLLDINKLEARQMDLVHEVGNLPDFIRQIVDLFRPSADIKNLSLIYQTDLSTGNYLFDAGKWEKILYNLVANAIKYTATGSITVGLFQTPTGVRLTVQDTGVGISTEKLPYIFDRYYQANPVRHSLYEGTGIGLALVYELVTRLDGQIQVESGIEGLERGTRFSLDLPVQRVSDIVEAQSILTPVLTVEPPPVSQLPSGNGISDKPLILIVEDDAELREFIVSELAMTYRIRVAANGHDGWILAKEELPDVIITDLMMPRMNGYDLIERLKTDASTDHIAVILLTAQLEYESRFRGYEYGADDYLTKPFHIGELGLRLRNLLDRQQKLRHHYRQQLAQTDSVSPLPTLTDQFLRRLYVLLEQRLDDSSLSVEWLAEQLAMSRKALNQKLQTLTNLTPLEIIRQYRLRKAIELLRLGHNASETAYMVGFESPSYFTRVFREYYQQTPTDFLKR